ncbi:hypothetical protein BGAL_0442g00060 [Botrytis galanthina]|uniref:FAD-binding PCMH-type domain-containing protein n=1 Tax=Botrytis galanthina TaxID=278940 RepID=A0A4S8QWB5_9HELO|nr:hypothetical protein BGAL_0442g00060 [Botrytis galanthina]
MAGAIFGLILSPLLFGNWVSADNFIRDIASDVVGCATVEAIFPDKVFYSNSTIYQYENKNFWSQTEYLSPECVFRPTTARDVAAAVALLGTAEGRFAVRGGGHMAIKGSNNIDNGVLIVMSNLTTLSISDDYSTLSVGPSHRWGDVYSYLQTYNRAVLGGRLASVGVPGLLLAGGVNFYGNQHGFSADMVIGYEVVLANGTIVYATSSSYADLFWALKGGSSNFGIATRFDLKTVPSERIWAGIYTVAQDYIPEFYAAIANYSTNIVDPLSHIVPAVIPVDSTTSVGAVILFYDSTNISYPACFESFTSIPSISNTLDFKTLTEFSLETNTAVTPNINDVFVAGTIVGKTYDELLQGIKIINDTFYSALPELYAQLPAENISIIEIDWQPIGSLWLSASEANGGNALGLDSSKGTYLCYAEVVEWIGSAYDEIVAAWVEKTTYAINNATEAAGLYDPFNYMGDAAGFQSIFPGYGATNEARLLSVSRKYDPTRLFQTLMPGGYKIGI